MDTEQFFQDVVPTRGTFVFANFATLCGHRTLFRLADPQGTEAPFAAKALLFNAERDLLANTLIADNGRAPSDGRSTQSQYGQSDLALQRSAPE